MIITDQVRRRLGFYCQTFSMGSNAMWYVICAAEGMPRAFSALGYLIDTHPRYKSLKRRGEDIYCYRLAAKLGDYMGAYNLGQSYEVGDGVAKSMRWAVYWWKQAAKAEYTKAKTCLAAAYYNGEGVKRNRQKALELYGQASLGGDQVATRMLSKLVWDVA